MPEHSHSSGILEIERSILRQLCSRASERCGSALRELAAYGWHDREHQVVYEALLKVRARDPESLRERLPAQATQMGFPDVAWEIYFAPEPPADLERLILDLKTAMARRP